MEKTDIKTIAEAKAYVREHFNRGERCPCCGQMVKLYQRKLNAGMAYSLIAAFRFGGENFIHIPTEFTTHKINASNSEFSKLRYWGLVEEQLNEDTKKRNSGFWRVTQKGIDFIHCEISVPKYINLFDGKLVKVGIEHDHIFIDQCLGDGFDYSELMKGLRK